MDIFSSVRPQLQRGQLPPLIRKQIDAKVTFNIIRGRVSMHHLRRHPNRNGWSQRRTYMLAWLTRGNSCPIPCTCGHMSWHVLHEQDDSCCTILAGMRANSLSQQQKRTLARLTSGLASGGCGRAIWPPRSCARCPIRVICCRARLRTCSTRHTAAAAPLKVQLHACKWLPHEAEARA